MSKRAGRHSSQSNDFLQPQNITSLSGVNVGTNRPYLATANTTSAASAAGTGGAVSLTWTLPANSPAATSYIITTTPSTYTVNTGSSTTSYTFEGLASEVSYTFTVTAQNAVGNSNPVTSSSISVSTVPQQPQSPSAVSTVADQDSVSWSAGATGGSGITSYTVTSSDGPVYTNATSPLTVTETGGTSQTYTIVAINANGTSAGAVTASVTTVSPFFPPFFPPSFFAPPFFPPSFFAPPFFPPSFFAPPQFFAPPFFPPSFFSPPSFVPPTFSRCIDQDTPIMVVGEDNSIEFKPARLVSVGDEIWSATFEELVDEKALDPYTWISNSLTDVHLSKTKIVAVIPSMKDVTMYINDDMTKRFSLEQTVLTRKQGQYFFGTTGTLEVGDTLIERKSSGDFVEILVKKIDIVDEQRTVYEFDADPVDILIAGGLVVHNVKRFA